MADPAPSFLAKQYRHTSFLRGFDSLDDEKAEQPYPNLQGPLGLPDARRVDKPRSLHTSSLYDSCLLARQTPSPDESETMAAASTTDASSVHGDLDVPASHPDKEMVKLNASKNSHRSPRTAKREGSWPHLAHFDKTRSSTPTAYRDEQLASIDRESYRPAWYDRPLSYDVEGERIGLPSIRRHGEGDRLPGIAHLDRQMHTPWSAGVTPAQQKDQNGPSREVTPSYASYEDQRATEGSARAHWGAPSSSLRRAGEEEHASHLRTSQGESRSGEPSPLMASHSHGARYPHAQSYPDARNPSYSPYKRPGSPLDQERDYDRQTGYAMSYRGEAGRGGGGDEHAHAPWRSPPAPRSRSPTDADVVSRPEHRPWRSTVYDTHPGVSRTTHQRSMNNGHHDERPALPILPPRGPTTRHDLYPSPPLRSSFDGHRLHGGSTSSSGSSGDHYAYRSMAAMPRASAPSLRSLSMPYPYDGGHAGVHSSRDYDSVDSGPAAYYDDVAPRHDHASSLHSSPRHHPYAVPGHGHPRGSGLATDPITGSPPNIPRRRGKLPKPVTDLLKTWLLDHAAHPYPTEDEKRRLCAATGLSISQVSNWFINARRRILVPQGSGHFGVGPAAGSGGASAASRQSPAPLHPHRGPQHDAHMSELAMHHGPPPPRHHGMPLAPPPLPVHHYGSSANSGQYRMSDPYPRSAEHSPRITRMRDSP